MKSILITAALSLAFSAVALAQSATNFLSTPEVLRFSDKPYSLSWSSHPNDNYYKQEYLPKGENAEHYNSMLMVEALEGATTVQQAVEAQKQQINERKGTDAVASYNVTEDKGETILDFMMSEGNIVEWDVYRYKALPGNKGIMLYALSKRAYSNTPAFVKTVKDTRTATIHAFLHDPMPVVKVP
jgi:hypothetical protein